MGGRIGGVQQKGLPASAINGKGMQDANDKSIPQDVQEKLLFCEGGTCRLRYERQVIVFQSARFPWASPGQKYLACVMSTGRCDKRAYKTAIPDCGKR